LDLGRKTSKANNKEGLTLFALEVGYCCIGDALRASLIHTPDIGLYLIFDKPH